MTTIKNTVTAVVMIGLIMPVSFLANIQDVLKSDAIVDLQEELDALAADYEQMGGQLAEAREQWQATHSDESKAWVNRLIMARMQKLVEVDRVRLEIAKIKIEAINPEIIPTDGAVSIETLRSELNFANLALNYIEEALNDLVVSAPASREDLVLLKTSKAISVPALDTPAQIRDTLVKVHRIVVSGLGLKLRAVNMYEIYDDLAGLLHQMTEALDEAGLWEGDVYSRITNDGWGAVNPIKEAAYAAYVSLAGLDIESDLDEVKTAQGDAKDHLEDARDAVKNAKDVLKDIKAEVEALLKVDEPGSGGGDDEEEEDSGETSATSTATTSVGECDTDETLVITKTNDSRGAIWRCVPNTYYVPPKGSAPKSEKPLCTQGKELTYKKGQWVCRCPRGETLILLPGGDHECGVQEAESNEVIGGQEDTSTTSLKSEDTQEKEALIKCSSNRPTCFGGTLRCSNSGKYECTCPAGRTKVTVPNGYNCISTRGTSIL